MTKFDKFVCDYSKVHTIDATIQMLTDHKAYIEYCKYDKSVSGIKKDNEKISHIKSMIAFLKLIGDDSIFIDDFKGAYFNE